MNNLTETPRIKIEVIKTIYKAIHNCLKTQPLLRTSVEHMTRNEAKLYTNNLMPLINCAHFIERILFDYITELDSEWLAKLHIEEIND